MEEGHRGQDVDAVRGAEAAARPAAARILPFSGECAASASPPRFTPPKQIGINFNKKERSAPWRAERPAFKVALIAVLMVKRCQRRLANATAE